MEMESVVMGTGFLTEVVKIAQLRDYTKNQCTLEISDLYGMGAIFLIKSHKHILALSLKRHCGIIMERSQCFSVLFPQKIWQKKYTPGFEL